MVVLDTVGFTPRPGEEKSNAVFVLADLGKRSVKAALVACSSGVAIRQAQFTDRLANLFKLAILVGRTGYQAGVVRPFDDIAKDQANALVVVERIDFLSIVTDAPRPLGKQRRAHSTLP
jgi:hypothetical protein